MATPSTPSVNLNLVLEHVGSTDITVQVEGGGAFQIPFRDIAKATLDFEF